MADTCTNNRFDSRVNRGVFSPDIPGRLSYKLRKGSVQIIRTCEGVEEYVCDIYSDDQKRLKATADMILEMGEI